jgi:hypothetical protein
MTMTTRISMGRVVAAATMAALAAFGSSEAVAEEFAAGGQITTIDDGNVKAAGNSGRFVVKNRHVGGTLSGFIGDTPLVNVPFTFTFGTNVPIMTQSGNIHGALVIDDGAYEAKVAAQSKLGVTPAPCPAAWAAMYGCIETSPGRFFFPGLLINGKLTITGGAAQGHGTVDGYGSVDGWVIPVIDPATGHIVGVFAGALSLQSK